MRKIFTFILIIHSFLAFSQKIKTQIGTSTWMKNDIIFVDKEIDYIKSFDKEQRLEKEWKINRDTSGKIIDTVIVKVDTTDKETYYYGGKEHWYFKYDTLGTLIEITFNRKNNLIVIDYEPTYDKSGKLIKTIQSTNGVVSNGPPTLYTYKGRTTIKKEYNNLFIQKKDKLNRIIYSKTETIIAGKKSVTIVKWKRNKNGNVVKYTKLKDGKLIKKTIHNYIDGIEQSQIEEYFNPNYQVVTKFSYEYWD